MGGFAGVDVVVAGAVGGDGSLGGAGDDCLLRGGVEGCEAAVEEERTSVWQVSPAFPTPYVLENLQVGDHMSLEHHLIKCPRLIKVRNFRGWQMEVPIHQESI